MRSECAKNFLAFVIRLLLNDVCSFHNNTISSVLIFLLGCFQLKLADLDFEQLATEFWLTDMSSCSARLRPSLDFLRILYLAHAKAASSRRISSSGRLVYVTISSIVSYSAVLKSKSIAAWCYDTTIFLFPEGNLALISQKPMELYQRRTRPACLVA